MASPYGGKSRVMIQKVPMTKELWEQYRQWILTTSKEQNITPIEFIHQLNIPIRDEVLKLIYLNLGATPTRTAGTFTNDLLNKIEIAMINHDNNHTQTYKHTLSSSSSSSSFKHQHLYWTNYYQCKQYGIVNMSFLNDGKIHFSINGDTRSMKDDITWVKLITETLGFNTTDLDKMVYKFVRIYYD
jgi:hypothetical protein